MLRILESQSLKDSPLLAIRRKISVVLPKDLLLWEFVPGTTCESMSRTSEFANNLLKPQFEGLVYYYEMHLVRANFSVLSLQVK